jgi:rod shape determining protein RodA
MSRLNITQEQPGPTSSNLKRSFSERLHVDFPLLFGLVLLLGFGLFILYSADNKSMILLIRQGVWVVIALVVMLILAQIPPRKYHFWAPWLYSVGVVLLAAVLAIGHVGNGAQRWLTLGVIHFQPSEMMKIVVPMTLAWLIDKKTLPPKFFILIFSGILLIIPVLLTAKQPDLGTALIIACSGIAVLFLSGIRWRYVLSALILGAFSAPVLWHFLHDYQRDRVLTFLAPERDPLGTGYHIIQSKIAIGSGGLFGKGYLNGTQSHLQFLPEHSTDFIFAVGGEELGLIGCAILILLCVFISLRGLYISTFAQDAFTRLVAGSLSLTFFLSVFINMGMVSGILPVVGVPLPLVSYGGTAMVSILAGFGIIMSARTHRKLLGR